MHHQTPIVLIFSSFAFTLILFALLATVFDIFPAWYFKLYNASAETKSLVRIDTLEKGLIVLLYSVVSTSITEYTYQVGKGYVYG